MPPDSSFQSFSLWEVRESGQTRHETRPSSEGRPAGDYVGRLSTFRAPDLDRARWVSDLLLSSVVDAPEDVMRGLHEAVGSLLIYTLQNREETMPLTEYATRVQPMSTHEALAEQGRQRYEPGKGPWTKGDDLDQVDLVQFETVAVAGTLYSDLRGLLSGCVDRLVHEVRRARGWPTPPKAPSEFMYTKSGK